MTQKTLTRAALFAGAAAISLTMGAGAATSQDAKVVTNKGADKEKLSLSGQFTRQIQYLDDGGAERFRHEDSNMSSSRIRFHADGKINADLSVGELLEVGVDDNRNQGARNVGAKNGDFFGVQVGGTHATGFGGNVIYGELDRDAEETNGPDARTWEAQLHSGMKFSELGKTIIIGEFVYTDSMSLAGDIGKSWSIILAQDIDSAAMNMFARFTQASLDRDGLGNDGLEFDVEDANLFTVGTGVKF